MNVNSQPLFIKIYRKGFKWFYHRFCHEFIHPRFALTKYFFVKVAFIRSFFKINKNTFSDLFSNDFLFVIYDLNIEAITYDFAHFIAAADTYGKLKNKNNLYVIFIQREINPLLVDRDYTSVVSEDSQNWRFSNIVLELVQIYPNCVGYSFFPSEMDISGLIGNKLTYPPDYNNFYKPGMDYKEIFKLLNLNVFTGFRATNQGLNYIDKWINSNVIEKPIVTITIRQYEYDTARNSNVEEWVKFAAWAGERGYEVIFIPDTDACWIENILLDEFTVFNEPCWNLGLRMALYERAFTNLFYAGGPSAICTLSKVARSIIFFPIIEESLQATSAIINNFGLVSGQRRYNFAKKFQCLSWRRDYFENIRDEFIEFVKLNG